MILREKRVLVPLLATLALLTAVPDVSACPRLFGRLRQRFAGGGGGCNGGGGGGGDGGQQQQQQQDQQQQQQGDNTAPINDTVSFRYVQYVPPAPVQGFVNPIAPPAPLPDTVAKPQAALPPPAVTPKVEVADDSGGRPGVGIAAVEKRTTALEAQVATLTQQVAQLTAALSGQTTRSTVYMSAAAPAAQYQAAPAVQYQTIPAQSVPVYYPQTTRYQLGAPQGCADGSCGPQQRPGFFYRQ